MRHLLDAFGAVTADPRTVEGARLILATLFGNAMLRDPGAAVGLSQAVAAISQAPGPLAAVYDRAFDLAVGLARPRTTAELVNQVSAQRDVSVPDVRPWLQSPGLGDFSAPASWWARHFAAFMVLEGNADAAAAGPGLLAAAAELVRAPAFMREEPAGRPVVLAMVRWLLEQSPLPPQATQTRRWLAMEGQIANFEPRNTAWDAARDVARRDAQLVYDVARYPIDNPEKTAIGLGTVALVGAAIGAAIYAEPIGRALKGLRG